MEHRRTWSVALDGNERRIEVVYAALSGWMSIEVDGERRQRGWREWQTVFGGAELACEVDGHRVAARVTQPYGRQSYAFALTVDGVLQPGSDPQPEGGKLKRQTVLAIAAISVMIGLVTLVTQLVSRPG